MNGILLVNKPQDFTSHDVIAKLRGILRERRLGHAGTLDPMATGLLVVFAGRATRAVQFAESHRKRYIAHMRCGIATDTQDITGNVLNSVDIIINNDTLCKLLPEFTGDLDQIPPMYSAIKKDGKKLYELARKGVEVERQPRKITIHKLEFLGLENGDFILDITCSKGTYIRTLVHDMGQKLGCGATLSYLHRVESGEFSVENAYGFDEISEYAQQGRAQELFIPVDSLFEERPEFAVNDYQKAKILCGNDFPCQLQDGEYRVYAESGEFLMLGRVENCTMHTIKSFFEV